MNPKTKEQLRKSVAIGAAGAAIDTLAVTLSLHRSQTHNAFTFGKRIDRAARLAIWTSGTSASEWITIHRRHHRFADTENDPHSPVQRGRWGVYKLWLRNTIDYNREAKRIRRENDFEPGIDDGYLDRSKKTGLAVSLIGHIAANKIVGNPPRMGALSWLIEKSAYIAAGNTVNSVGHSGASPVRALLLGEIIPHEDGGYGSDSAVVALLTMGEGRQKSHHEHPERVFFGDHPEDMSITRRLIHDTGGAIALGLINRGLATAGTEKPS